MFQKERKEVQRTSVTDKNAKRFFNWSNVIRLIVVGYIIGALSSQYGVFPIPQLSMVKSAIINGQAFWEPSISHLQPSRGQGNGVVINNAPDDNQYVLMTGFFDNENQIRLIHRDGTVFKKWSLDYSKHFPDSDSRPCSPLSSLAVDTHGVHLTPEGEVVFNYEYCGAIKLDQCGNVVWKINQPTHHSIVPAEKGGYWVLNRLYWNAKEEPNRLPPYSSSGKDVSLSEDTIMRVSEDGKILEQISIPELMRENGLEALLTSNGLSFRPEILFDKEIVHANKVAELSSSLADTFPLFDAGDLAVSLRQLNLIFVLDPINKKIKWHQTGPWIRQHDPEFRSDGRISIFNNNVYRTAYSHERTNLNHKFSTNIIAVDPVSRKTEVIYGEKSGQEMLSVIRGQHELLKNHGMLITEFDAGRVFELDSDNNMIWEYVNQYDSDNVGEITNAVVYPSDYFQESFHSCNEKTPVIDNS